MLHFRKRCYRWGGSRTLVTRHGKYFLFRTWAESVWLKTGWIYLNLLLSFWIRIHLYSFENRNLQIKKKKINLLILLVTVFCLSLCFFCLSCIYTMSIHIHCIMHKVLRCQYHVWIKEDQRHPNFILKGFHLQPYHNMKLKAAVFSAFPSWKPHKKRL